jgi:mannosyl-3-phosphoglycerate phosphatase
VQAREVAFIKGSLRLLPEGAPLKKIIFTDLDGTLLHPETYSFEEARPALDSIRANHIPLVLCSSKTRVELVLYRERLHIGDPFISENGGGIFVPKGYFSFIIPGEAAGDCIVTKLGMSYRKIRDEFVSARKQQGADARGFGDMTVEEVAAITGLRQDEAAMAQARDFSEPFCFAGQADKTFLKALEERGLNWTQGRLFHVMGDHDKGKPVRMLKKWYEKEHGKIISIGLGDAFNDLPLLKEVDYPVLVQKPYGDYDSNVSVKGLIRAPGVGPRGWNKALLELLRS